MLQGRTENDGANVCTYTHSFAPLEPSCAWSRSRHTIQAARPAETEAEGRLEATAAEQSKLDVVWRGSKRRGRRSVAALGNLAIIWPDSRCATKSCSRRMRSRTSAGSKPPSERRCETRSSATCDTS